MDLQLKLSVLVVMTISSNMDGSTARPNDLTGLATGADNWVDRPSLNTKNSWHYDNYDAGPRVPAMSTNSMNTGANPTQTLSNLQRNGIQRPYSSSVPQLGLKVEKRKFCANSTIRSKPQNLTTGLNEVVKDMNSVSKDNLTETYRITSELPKEFTSINSNAISSQLLPQMTTTSESNIGFVSVILETTTDGSKTTSQINDSIITISTLLMTTESTTTITSQTPFPIVSDTGIASTSTQETAHTTEETTTSPWTTITDSTPYTSAMTTTTSTSTTSTTPTPTPTQTPSSTPSTTESTTTSTTTESTTTSTTTESTTTSTTTTPQTTTQTPTPTVETTTNGIQTNHSNTSNDSMVSHKDRRANYTGVCPNTDDISPCTCVNHTISCKKSSQYSLGQIFKAISNVNAKDKDMGHFDGFEMYNSAIDKLEDNVFQGITFERIVLINCKQLICVSQKAFNGLEKSLQNFVALNTSFSSLKSECNIFNAIKKLKNLRSINITSSGIREIPSRAFSDDNVQYPEMTSIDMRGGPGGGEITKIGQKAFESLKGLTYINLSSNKVSRIETNAFVFKEKSNQNLLIDLSRNLLTEQSFDTNSLSLNGRTTELRLDYNSNIKVLKEKTFMPFLNDSGVNNTIHLKDIELKCIYQNSWILENRVKVKHNFKDLSQEFWKHSSKDCMD